MSERTHRHAVVEGYVDKMPYRFSGTSRSSSSFLEPQKLSEEE
jgi:hypothetical protein